MRASVVSWVIGCKPTIGFRESVIPKTAGSYCHHTLRRGPLSLPRKGLGSSSGFTAARELSDGVFADGIADLPGNEGTADFHWRRSLANSIAVVGARTVAALDAH